MKDLSTIFNKLRKDGRLFGWGASPHADWKVIFVLTVLLVLCVTALNIYVFLEVKNTEKLMILETHVESREALDLDKLGKVVLYYQNKSAEFDRIRTGTSSIIVDPSI